MCHCVILVSFDDQCDRRGGIQIAGSAEPAVALGHNKSERCDSPSVPPDLRRRAFRPPAGSASSRSDSALKFKPDGWVSILLADRPSAILSWKRRRPAAGGACRTQRKQRRSGLPAAGRLPVAQQLQRPHKRRSAGWSRPQPGPWPHPRPWRITVFIFYPAFDPCSSGRSRRRSPQRRRRRRQK